jgi:hypothetical protein
MRTDSIEKVRHTLGARSLTVRELTKTGLSRNTIVGALEFIGAEQIEGSYPAKYRMPLANVKQLKPADRSTPTITTAKDRVMVEREEADDWVPRWNNAREQFGIGVGGLGIELSSNPKELSEQFAKAAHTLASISYALQQHQGKPDWYVILGGSLDDSAQTK